MSHTCNVTTSDFCRDVDKDEIRQHFVDAGELVLGAGGNFFTASTYIENLQFDDALDDLRATREKVDEALKHLQQALTLTEEGLPLVKEAEEYFKEFDYDSLQAKAEVEDLFVDDDDAMEYLLSTSKRAEITAGVEMYTSLLSEFRSSLDGMMADIEAGHTDGHLLRGTWRTTTLYTRTVNVGAMISYINRETRRGAERAVQHEHGVTEGIADD